ncbi:NAD(P)-dependent alcohol dehydrogenase (plasmid) [Cupriavidus sp. KK10]|uniref:zinc-dependent alcohol dehydrogenase family protein n=1 Tax=Cupriavidus sp. KK10 TaxID=1478019 RepID=UPI001BA49501|nr:NAD(P)-dependent alcohol dehydrogenase [Cupriavidus sp. KK10]QUN32375.1 NAD(P)-dependent alcohol dehydrogenase [Cupriavidus sp. KK10]
MAITMRLGRPAGIDQLVPFEEDPGRPGAGEVLVRVRGSSLNFHDYLVVTGRMPTAVGRIPLSDGAGEIVEVGPPPGDEVDADPSMTLRVGEAVLGTFFRHWREGAPAQWGHAVVAGEHVDGYAREFAVVPVAALTRVPHGLSLAEAATLPCAGLTAWRALGCCGGIRPGDVVLVQGTGGVSVFALQFAKAMGATVVATSSSEGKLERLRALGASHVINYRAEPNWGRAAKRWTGGRGVDHIVDIGGADLLNQSIEACRTGGSIALVGLLAGTSGRVATGRIMAQQVRLQGVVVGSRTDQLEMIRAIESLGVRPVIDSSFQLQELPAAFRRQEAGRHFGKIVVEM